MTESVTSAAETAALTARVTATEPVATAAAISAAAATTTAQAAAATVNSTVPGMQQQINNMTGSITANTAGVAAGVAATGAVANRTTATEITGAANTAAISAQQQQNTNTSNSVAGVVTSVAALNAALGAVTSRVTALEGATPPAVPNPPTGTTSGSQTSTTITVAATAAGSGPAATSTIWEYKLDTDTIWTTSALTTLTGTISGLTAAKLYNVRPTAKNAVGPSVPGPLFKVSTAAGTLVESAHDAQITTPTSASSPLVDAALNAYTLVGTTSLQIAINGVLNAVTANVVQAKYYNPVGAAAPGVAKHQVVHQNAAGNWYMSGTITANIAAWTQIIGGDPDLLPVVVPNIPPIPTSTAVTSSSITVSGTLPVGGPTPTSQLWQWKRRVDPIFITAPLTTLTGTISGLPALTLIDITDAAVNLVGPSAPSPVYSVSTASAPLIESAHDTTLTTIASQIVDANLNVYTLVNATAPATGLQIAINGVLNTITNNVVLMKYYNPVGTPTVGVPKHTTVQENSSGNWYLPVSITANQGAWTLINSGDPDIAPPAGVFTVAGGRITGPTGVDFQAKGINVPDASMGAYPASVLLAKFPGLNFIRFAIGVPGAGFSNAQSDASLFAYIADITAHGIVCMCDNHIQQGNSVSWTTAEPLYTRLANQFKTNPWVWFESQNEVINGGSNEVSQGHQAIYNAVRATGNNNIVVFCPPGGNPGSGGMTAGTYTGMVNVGWDMHCYNWMSGGSTDQTFCNNRLANDIRAMQAFVTTASGPGFVISGEGGYIDYSSGGDPNVDTLGGRGTNQNVMAMQTIGKTVGSGYAVWLSNQSVPFGWGTMADLIAANGSLTRGGLIVAANINV
jgi:hypothetical protein